MFQMFSQHLWACLPGPPMQPEAVMNEIAHLLEKHCKEMAELENEQRKSQRQRESKLKELERLANEARALNTEACDRELSRHAV